MGRFTDMFNKTVRAKIRFLDLDNGYVKIDSVEVKGKPDALIDYDPSEKIKELTDRGYELAQNDLDTHPRFDGDGHVYSIGFHHRTVTVDADHPAYGYSKDQLAMTVTQRIHYEGAYSRTPTDNVSKMSIHKKLVVDEVNGEVIKESPWQGKFSNFELIATPIVPGFVPDQKTAGGKAINVYHPDEVYTVKYKLNDHPVNEQTVKIEYVDILSDNKIIAQDKVKGKVNMPIDYDPKPKLSELSEQGYDLVDNPFNGDDNVQFFGDSDQEPVFVITLKHNFTLVNDEHPLDGIDPERYRREVHFTVRFTGAGDQTPKARTQTAILTRSLFVVPKTKKIVGSSKWQSNIKNYNNVKVPAIDGYAAPINVVIAKQIGMQDQEVEVHYTSQKTPQAIVPVASHEQTAIISFIDVGRNGTLITSSGALTGQPGESINDLYSTEIPLKVLKQTGYVVVFNNFDAPGVTQRFDNNDMVPQIFTIGLKKAAQNNQRLKIVNTQE